MILPQRRTGSHTRLPCTPATRQWWTIDGVTGSRRDPRDPEGRRDPRYYPPRPPADHGDEHPGMANYPSDGAYRRQRRAQQTPSANRWLPPLDEPTREHRSDPPPRNVGTGAGE